MSIHQFPGGQNFQVRTQHTSFGTLYSVSGGGGGGSVEARIAKLESDVGHISGNIERIQTDIRDFRNWGIAAVVGLAGMIAGDYFLSSGHYEALNQKMTQVLIGIQQLSDEVSHKP